MAKLQSKVKLRSGEVVTIDHVKPSKPAPKDETKKPEDKTPKADEPKKPEDQTPKADETNKTNETPKETK